MSDNRSALAVVALPEVDEAALSRYEIDRSAWTRRAGAARQALGATR